MFNQARSLLEGLDFSAPDFLVKEQKKRLRVIHTPEIILPDQKSFKYRMWKHPWLMHYNRLIFICLVVNIYIFIKFQSVLVLNAPAEAMNLVSRFILGNFLVALIIRNQHVINLMFRFTTSFSTNWPLSLRWSLGKVYHFGGIHVGCAISGTIWCGYLVVLKMDNVSIESFGITLITFLLMVLMGGVASPKNREKNHDRFEKVARFGGWLLLALFWIEYIMYSQIYLDFMFVGLIILTLNAIHPWLYLKKVKVKTLRPSNHAVIAEFEHSNALLGSSTTLSKNPLMEWHSFANIPWPSKNGFRLIISRAGDWTGDFIDTCPKEIWVKGFPTAGVGNVEKLFKKVLYVATGSGIGPCLPHLIANEVDSNLVWSTRTPEKTYGQDLVDEIMESRPKSIIWDTIEKGKPDMLELTYKAFVESGAEAVICISNKKLTWEVVYGLESRGIPAFGAIWDS